MFTFSTAASFYMSEDSGFQTFRAVITLIYFTNLKLFFAVAHFFMTTLFRIKIWEIFFKHKVVIKMAITSEKPP